MDNSNLNLIKRPGRRILTATAIVSALVAATILVLILNPKAPEKKTIPKQTIPKNISTVPQKTIPKKISTIPKRISTVPKTTQQEKDRNLRAEQLKEALKLYNQFPSDDNAVYLLGLIYQEQGNSVKAIETWKKCMKLDPDRPDLCNSLGFALYLKGKYDDAAKLFQQALKINPRMFSAVFHLADLYLRTGQFKKSVALLEGYTGSNPLAYRTLGQSYQELNDYKKAEDCFKKAIDIDQNLTKAYYGLITVCAHLKEFDKVKKYRKIFSRLKKRGQKEGRDSRRKYDSLEITRKSVSHTHTDLGRIYISQGKTGEAEKLLQRAIKLDSKNLRPLFSLAQLYEETKRNKEALPLYQQLTRLEPGNGVHYLFLGNLFFQLKQMSDAEKAFKKTIELGPSHPEGYAALSNLYLYTNRNLKKGLSLAAKAVRLLPSSYNCYVLSIAYEKNGNITGAIKAIQAAIKKNPHQKKYRQRYTILMNRERKSGHE